MPTDPTPISVPFTVSPFPKSMDFPAETADGQPYDLFWFDDGEGWHKVVRLEASTMDARLGPFVLTVCSPDPDERTPSVLYEGELTTAIPDGGWRAECACWK